MKLTVAFLLFVFLGASARGLSQEVILSGKNISLKKIFSDIEQQTGYAFFYNNNDIGEALVSAVSLKEVGVRTALTKILKDLKLAYDIQGKTIFIREAPHLDPSPQPTPAAVANLDISVQGAVTDSVTGTPLSGVTIQVKGSTRGTTTGPSGKFSLSVPEDAVLIVSYLGYDRKEIKVGGRKLINIALVPSQTGLNEVVVLGYGVTKKKTLTGSVASIKGEDIIKAPVINVSNSISGRLPGVTAVTRSGEPGKDGSTIRIRGSNTLGDNNALVVIDGIPGRSLERVDPNSIESITVLKDASAAIYGSQAANGVILITTKRGKIGKPQVSVNVSRGFTQPTRIPKMTNAAQYATALNELDQYAGISPRYTEDDIQKFADGSDPWGHPNTDWFDAVLKNWSAQLQGNVTVSGGSEFMQYFVSLGAKSEDAFYKHSATKYNQYNLRTNLDINVTKDKSITLALDVAGRLENSNFPGRTGAGTDIFGALQRGKPTMPAYWPNGLPGPDVERGENPVALATNMTGFTDNKYYVFNSNLKLNINIPWVEGLSLTGNAALDKGFRFNKNFQQPWYLYSWDGLSYDDKGIPVLVKGKKGIDDPNLNEYMEDNYDYLLNGLVNYTRTIATNHHIGFLAGAEARAGKGDNFSAYRRYFVSTVLPQLDEGGSNALDNAGSASHDARLNYFGRVNYDYKEKYLAEFVWRVDGSYIFPQAGRYGFFPGLSVGWRLSEENFWKDHLSAISDNVKLRASYGETGNDRIDPYQYLSTYSFNTASYIFDIANESKALMETRLPNPNVTWEVAKQADVGIDASFLQDKLSVTFDYFDYHRSNILWARNASVPASTGLTLPRENIGKVRNRGFDFYVGYDNAAGDFKYTVALNGGYAKNKITFWDESPGAPAYQRSTGHPMPTDPNNPNNDLYYQAIGIFRDQDAVDNYPHWPGARPGDVIFKDVNDDGVIDANDRVRSDKNDIPTLTGGLNAQLQYRQFDLSILFQGAAGAVRYLRFEAAGNFGNYLLSDFTDRWTPDNPDGTKPRMFDRTDQYYRSERSTYLVHNTDFVRLKNLELGYSLPPAFLKRIGIQQFRIYASGYNLFTYSPGIKDFDPEDNNQGGINYPLQRIVTFGLTLTL
ncbi:TonB-dependent receptor [Compostibacter hankyongensis]|uniref:TonB-dependent receptor n=1 Tax=Compostibacter hankyongensis TaxID=1007089 RepID=A0ABP8FJF9_9BACT